MMTDLKPCPFCGCTATLNFTNDNHHSPWVRCDGAIQTNRTKSCFACQYPWNFKTKEAAIEAWNRRAQPENEPLTLVHCHDCTNYRRSVGQDRGKCLYYDQRFDVGDDHFCGYGVSKRRKPERSEG